MHPQAKIDRLRVATPCPISWEQMRGNDRVRFCDHCQLNVYNISELTRTEAELLISSSEGRLCARLYRRADGTVLTKDCPVGLRAFRKRVVKRVASVFAAMVSISSAAFGQQAVKEDDQGQCRQGTRVIVRTNRDQTAANIQGRVIDACGAAVAHAEVLIAKGEANQITGTDDEGKFSLPLLPEGNYSLKVTGLGFSPYVLQLQIKRNQTIAVEIVLEPGYLTGDIVVVEPQVYFDSRPGTTIIKGDIAKKFPIQ